MDRPALTAADPGVAVGASVEVEIERMAYGGDGVGHVDGLVVFVPWTAPGDRARAEVVERHPRWARARLAGIVSPGPERVEPGCPVYGVCGGCRVQHLERAAQLEAKARAVEDAMRRIARRAPPAPVRCEPAAEPWHYRRRAAFSWRRADDGFAFGFHAAADPGAIVDVTACPIFAEEGNRVLAGLREVLIGARGEGVEEGRLVVRALPDRDVQAGFFTARSDRARELAEACSARAGILVTWGTLSATPAPPSLAPGAPRLASWIELDGWPLRVGFDSFLQADPVAALRLYEAAEEGLEPRAGQRVMDGYAGVGALTCRLARKGVRVTAIESHPGAASDLRANAAAAGGSAGAEPVHVLELPAERVDWRRPAPEAVVVNPPRAGCAPAAIDAIGRSTARRIVYVSCDPTTLARDLRRLGEGWRLRSLRAFDLFPQTAHVETVATLEREGGG